MNNQEKPTQDNASAISNQKEPGLKAQEGSLEAGGRIVFEGLPNTRDLGYLSTASGQPLRYHKLIRSGALVEATETDISTLTKVYDVRTVVDLRTAREQEKSPDPQSEMPGVRFVDAPILGFSTTGITREDGVAGIAQSLTTLDKDPKQVMMDLYPGMLLDDAGIKGYTLFFETVASRNDDAVLWHCSAGKDRAGLATVLLLTVLGVSWSDIVNDYLATNLYLAGRASNLKQLFPPELLSQNLIDGLKIINAADEDYLNAGIKAVESAYGSLDAYLTEALGVTQDMREELRAAYLRC